MISPSFITDLSNWYLKLCYNLASIFSRGWQNCSRSLFSNPMMISTGNPDISCSMFQLSLCMSVVLKDPWKHTMFKKAKYCLMTRWEYARAWFYHYNIVLFHWLQQGWFWHIVVEATTVSLVLMNLALSLTVNLDIYINLLAHALLIFTNKQQKTTIPPHKNGSFRISVIGHCFMHTESDPWVQILKLLSLSPSFLSHQCEVGFSA